MLGLLKPRSSTRLPGTTLRSWVSTCASRLARAEQLGVGDGLAVDPQRGPSAAAFADVPVKQLGGGVDLAADRFARAGKAE